ncbi:hypothetical protein GOBAR_DD05857 [Gossypium barbadense]|nr:hypothetical protein GOBAR_DD05857 [Gossypium barbadense]
MNQFKVGDKVLPHKTDPQIATSELDANGSNTFTVLNIFPYGTVEVNHSEFDTFKVNNTQLKPYFNNRIDSEKRSFGSTNHIDCTCIRIDSEKRSFGSTNHIDCTCIR